MTAKLLKQHNVPRLGALIDSLYTSLPILSIINFLSILTVLYATTKDYLDVWVPWLTFWMFISFLGGLTMFTMVLIYKFVLPSVWTFRQKQMFGYESKLISTLEDISKRLKDLEENREEK